MKYFIKDESTYAEDSKGEVSMLANFNAEIIKETRFDDGKTKNTVLTVKGKNKTEVFDEVEVPAEKFPSMGWVLPDRKSVV